MNQTEFRLVHNNKRKLSQYRHISFNLKGMNNFAHAGKSISVSCAIKPNFDCNRSFPFDLAADRCRFACDKSIGLMPGGIDYRNYN